MDKDSKDNENDKGFCARLCSCLRPSPKDPDNYREPAEDHSSKKINLGEEEVEGKEQLKKEKNLLKDEQIKEEEERRREAEIQKEKIKMELNRYKSNYLQKSSESALPTKEKKNQEVDTLILICRKAGIPQSRFKECLYLFEADQLEDLIQEAAEDDRKIFKEEIHKLKLKKNGSLQNKLTLILEKYEVSKKETLERCIELFEAGKYQELKQKLPRRFHESFQKDIDPLIKETNKSNIGNSDYGQSIIKSSNIDPANKVNPSKFEGLLNLTFRSEKIIVKFNQLFFSDRSKFLMRQLRRLTQLHLEDLQFFLSEKPFDILVYQFNPNESYDVFLFEVRYFTVVHNRKNLRVQILPAKQIGDTKFRIYREILKKQIKENEKQPFDFLNRIIIKIKINGYEIIMNNQMSLAVVEENNEPISTLTIEIMQDIILFYEAKEYHFKFSNCHTFSQLRHYLSDKYAPLQSQILTIFDDENNKEINSIPDLDKRTIGEFSKNHVLSLELKTKIQLQFYGFHKNHLFSFENFSEFTVENPDDIKKMIERCLFDQKVEEQYLIDSQRFIRMFIESVFSGIKKRFQIKTIIQKYKKLVTSIKTLSIWKPILNTQQGDLMVDEFFVLEYLLQNADSRLKIEVMNLVGQNMPLPLYQKSFETIFNVKQQLKLNEELMWIMSKGFVVASFGLHTAQNKAEEKGKSFLLNQIFPVQFLKRKVKHPILRGLPFIAVRVLQAIYPLHVIDIPHDCPDRIKKSILQVSNMAIIHSWKIQSETETDMLNLKKMFNIPMICLIRDRSGNETLGNLRDKWIQKEKPVKLMNISNKELYSAEISLLREKVFQYIKQSLERKQSEIDKIYGLFQKYQDYQTYYSFVKLIESLKNEFLDLCNLRQGMEMIAVNAGPDNKDIANQIKGGLHHALHPKIHRLVEFLSEDSVKGIRHMLLKLLREKLRIIQNQFNLKFEKLQQIKDTFKDIKHLGQGSEKQSKLKQLNSEIIKLTELGGRSIDRMKDADIFQLIEEMIGVYNNKVKSRIFSMELFWRQLNYQVNLNDNYDLGKGKYLRKLTNVIKELKQIEIGANLPFELIDGDLLEFPLKLMKSIFQKREEKVVVISVLGPQSSGKSTLLNFIFGCDFATSVGRCTRGVYGTFYKFGENKGSFSEISNCDGIFVIDTQGLFAITNDKDKEDQNRENFDSKLVIFCLAVSDFVIINVRGNLDNRTEKLLKLCHQRLQDLNIQKEKQPEICIVLNQNAQDKMFQSQNEFRQVRRTLDFEIGKSLTLAYNFNNYKHEQILLLGKKQTLSKKYPKQTFLRETTDLMTQIIRNIGKKKGIGMLKDIIIEFEKIWGLVVAFPNLTKYVSDECRKLQQLITKWKKEFQFEELDTLTAMFKQFEQNKITEAQIMDAIENHKVKLISEFEREFKERMGDPQDIKALKATERDKIINKTMSIKDNAKQKIERIYQTRKIQIAKIEGDKHLIEKAKQIASNQKNYTEEQIRKEFESTYQANISNIERKLDMSKEIEQQYLTLKYSYHYLLIELTNNQKGLPKQNSMNINKQCDVQTMDQQIREKILKPHQQRFSDLMVHTYNHTNVLKGGRTDASLEYFDMKDYFNVEQISDLIVITQSSMRSCLKKELLNEHYKKNLKEMQDKKLKKSILKEIFEQINKSLQEICIQLTDFQEFDEHYVINEFKSQFNYYSEKSRERELRYQVLLNKKKSVTHSKHNFSLFLKKYLIGNEGSLCLCQLNLKVPKGHLRKVLYQSIDWDLIIITINKKSNYQNKINKVNLIVTQSLNEDLQKLNLRIKNEVDWRTELQCSDDFLRIEFEVIKKDKKIDTEVQLMRLVQSSSFVNLKLFKAKFRPEQKREKLDYNDLPIFILSTKKLKPNQRNLYFKNYLRDETRLTTKEMQREEFKYFIFEELTQKRRVFDQFYAKIIEIVDGIIAPLEKLQKKTTQVVYNQVSKEISKLNNDLNQVSINLSEKYVGYIHLAVVYMIWKRIVSRKIEQKTKILQDKIKDKEKQYQIFKLNASKDVEKNIQGEITSLLEEIKKIIKGNFATKCEEIMNNEKSIFSKKNTRDIIQKHLDIQIFKDSVSMETIMKYIETPKEVIEKKYEQCYELSWSSVKNTLQSEENWFKTVEQFYGILNECAKMLKDHKIREQMKHISDFFKIVKNQSTIGGVQTMENDYQRAGKKVMFEYFIDILLSDDPHKNRKCAGVQIKPIYQLNIGVSVNSNLKTFLQKLRIGKNFTISSLVKFVNKLLEKETKSKLNEEIKTGTKIGEKHHLEFIALVQVSICSDKCPCCGRICGLEGAHTHHMCKYGHQMRGFNGSYYLRGDGKKEASVTRCQQLSQTDDIKYNGADMKWCQFKDYWNKKNQGGWNFEDATLKNDLKQNQLRFEKAWFLAGPAYCKKYNLQYVDSNKSQPQKKILSNIHFILAVDESGSMSGKPWNDLLVSLNQLVERIKKMENSNNLYRISLIKFNDNATLVFENQAPNKVNINIPYSGGNTSFDPPFNLAAQIARKYISNSTVAFIFMTDGDAPFPIAGIKAMKDLQIKNSNKLLYRGIEFKSKCEVFQTMANELGGKTGVAYNPEQLTQQFIKFVEHIVNREDK